MMVPVSLSVRDAAPRVCSVAGALDVIGEKWSLLVVRELILGVHRFNEIAANTGAPRDILTARLRRLEELGVVERQAYSERPPRYEYSLTKAGRDLRPVVMALKHWGDTHVMGAQMSPVLEHKCGEVFVPKVHCAACGEPADGRTLKRVDG
jgi:DNA-binding HxlR family transcriptional regulator